VPVRGESALHWGMQDFRRLLVLQRAHAFALDVRRVTDAFPRVGYADLKSQLRRAAESIATNIVEGCGASSRKEFARFLDISIKSASEVDYQLQFARDLGVLPHARWKPLAQEVVELRKMLSALRRTVLDAAQFRTRMTNLGARVTKPEGQSTEPQVQSAKAEGQTTKPEGQDLSTDDSY
jgi:four helix bundle protein